MSYEKSFPIKAKTITQKEKSHPWITELHLSDMRERDKLCKLSKKKKIDKSVYTDFRNALKNRLRAAKTVYFKNLFELHQNNIKKTWGVINDFISSSGLYGVDFDFFVVIQLTTSLIGAYIHI